MLNINGAELGLGEIIVCFIVVITVLKAISGVGSWILDTLNIYTKKRMIDEMKFIGVLKVCGYSKKLLSKISCDCESDADASIELSIIDQV